MSKQNFVNTELKCESAGASAYWLSSVTPSYSALLQLPVTARRLGARNSRVTSKSNSLDSSRLHFLLIRNLNNGFHCLPNASFFCLFAFVFAVFWASNNLAMTITKVTMMLKCHLPNGGLFNLSPVNFFHFISTHFVHTLLWLWHSINKVLYWYNLAPCIYLHDVSHYFQEFSLFLSFLTSLYMPTPYSERKFQFNFYNFDPKYKI